MSQKQWERARSDQISQTQISLSPRLRKEWESYGRDAKWCHRVWSVNRESRLQAYADDNDWQKWQQPANKSNSSMYLGRSDDYCILWQSRYMITHNKYDYKCYLCDFMWFLRGLKGTTEIRTVYLLGRFPEENRLNSSYVLIASR